MQRFLMLFRASADRMEPTLNHTTRSSTSTGRSTPGPLTPSHVAGHSAFSFEFRVQAGLLREIGHRLPQLHGGEFRGTQRLQYPLSIEYTVNYSRVPIMILILGLFLNSHGGGGVQGYPETPISLNYGIP